MKEIHLVAEQRNEYGRGASRRLRKAGMVPAIIYGVGSEATSASLDHNTVYHLLKREPFHTSILKIELNGKVEKVLLRDFQMHAFRQEVLHLDFQRVNETEEIHIRIPLHFINEDTSVAVKSQNAHITHVITDVEIRALASNIPQFIEVDLQNISAGQSVHLSDLAIPKNVALVNLIRGEDSVVAIAAGISEEPEQPVEVVSAADIPTVGEEAAATEAE